MKNIWIVGRLGMLAKALAQECEKLGFSYQATGKDEVDIRELTQIKQFVKRFRPSHIFNAGAYTKVDLAEKEKQLAFAINATGVENLALAAKEFQIKLIHFSTDYVFSGARLIPYREEDIPDPLNIYGETKWAGERAIWTHTDNGLIIRTSWLFGKGGTNFVSTMKQLMRQHETLSIIQDQRGRPTLADDLAKAALAIMDQKGIFHFANRGETTWYDLSKEILLRLQEKETIKCKKIEPIFASEYQSLAKRPQFSVLSTEKIEKVGIKIRTWKEALLDIL